MSAPRTKRPFAGAASDPAQRHITSFFHNKSPSCPCAGPAPPAAAAAPALPASVQSNLLSVGMRVRKSVPEGYKTGSTHGGFALWADADARGKNAAAAAAAAAASVSASASAAARRELLPFCGIHAVGGLSAQPAFGAASPLAPGVFGPSPLPGLDDVPSLTSSQESVESSSGGAPPAAAPPTRKRVYSDDDDDEDDDDDINNNGSAAAGDAPSVSDRPRVRRADWLDGEVSPRSMAPPGWENARVMAEPRRRRGAGPPGKALGRGRAEPLILGGLGQGDVPADDFGEADFLDFRWAAGGEDLDMGGV